MPLLDHFHAPLHPLRPWESFLGSWANALMGQLNELLPPRYFAAFQLHLGTDVEADVAELDLQASPGEEGNGAAGGLALATWAPPAVTCVMAATFPDDIEVYVVDTRDGAVVVAVVELVSPRNKDRAEARQAFAARCAAYLQRGIGLVVADIVTSRRANLHNDLVRLLGQPEACTFPADTPLYASAYRPARRQESNRIDTWLMPLAVGGALPVLPLALRGGGCVPLDLEAAYTRARQLSRL
jgi:hypothetical protein